MMSLSESTLSQSEKYLVIALRISLALIFLWFGMLKVAGYNPVYDLVYGFSPLLVTDIGFMLLGILEVIIGLGLMLNRFHFVVHTVLVFHLIGTFFTFLTAPEVMFDPAFPVLTLDGEFVIKNAILALSGLVVLVYERRRILTQPRRVPINRS